MEGAISTYLSKPSVPKISLKRKKTMNSLLKMYLFTVPKDHGSIQQRDQLHSLVIYFQLHVEAKRTTLSHAPRQATKEFWTQTVLQCVQEAGMGR